MSVLIDDLTSNGLVRRWEIIDGQPRCPLDALPKNDPGELAALKKTQAIRIMIASVEAYEAALAIVARGEPDNGQPKFIPDPAAIRPEDAPDDWAAPLVANPAWALLPRTVPAGENGQTAPEPRWAEYDSAQSTVAAASETTKALARWRAAEALGSAEHSIQEDDEEAVGAPWEADRVAVFAALAVEAAKPLAADPRLVQDEISDRQFWQAAAMLGYITEAEAEAAVTVGTIPALLLTAINSLPSNQRFSVRMAVAGSNVFRMSNPATSLLMQLLGKTEEDKIKIWRLGQSLP